MSLDARIENNLDAIWYARRMGQKMNNNNIIL